jgi:hypothetical protein
MQLVNLTPHVITLVCQDGNVVLDPAGPAARVTMAADEPVGSLVVDGIAVPLVRTATTGVVTGLPDPRPETLYVVSRQVLDACPDRADLVMTHGAIRGDGGAIIGCRALARPASTGKA